VVVWVVAALIGGILLGRALRRTGREPLEHELLESHLLVSDETEPDPDAQSPREPSPGSRPGPQRPPDGRRR
jgi:hypothetical protein